MSQLQTIIESLSTGLGTVIGAQDSSFLGATAIENLSVDRPFGTGAVKLLISPVSSGTADSGRRVFVLKVGISVSAPSLAALGSEVGDVLEGLFGLFEGVRQTACLCGESGCTQYRVLGGERGYNILPLDTAAEDRSRQSGTVRAMVAFLVEASV